MTDQPTPEEERDLVAAEYVLGLLERESLLEARGRVRGDPQFADAVTAWENRLAPLLEAIPEAAPPPDLWSRIEPMLVASGDASGEVISLRHRRNLWRGYATAMTAIAASLALVIGLRPGAETEPVVQPQAAPLLVASLSAPETETAVTLVYDRNQGTLLVTPAMLEALEGRDHELWVVPASGTPRSLGLIRADQPIRIAVAADRAELLGPRAALAISVEPDGGSPTGAPTGPVIASGELRPI